MFNVLDKNNKIVIYDKDKQRLINILLHKPNGLKVTKSDILETDDEIITLNDGTIDFKSNVEEQYNSEKTEKLFVSLRAERNKRIAETDYLILPDYPITKVNKDKVKEYRQELRDLPEQEGAPWDGGKENTPFPEFPEIS